MLAPTHREKCFERLFDNILFATDFPASRELAWLSALDEVRGLTAGPALGHCLNSFSSWSAPLEMTRSILLDATMLRLSQNFVFVLQHDTMVAMIGLKW